MPASSMFRRSAVLACTLALLAARCPTNTDPPPVIKGGLCGGGTVTLGGNARDYHVNSDSSHLYILSKRKSAVACSQFHHHAVAAQEARFQFSLDDANPAASTLTAEVTAASLDPDRPEYRAVFPVTATGDAPSDSDRAQIKVSVLEQVKAQAHPKLTFRAVNLSTLSGSGTAELQVNIAGEDSTTTFTGTAEMDGERLIISGSGTIDGRPHDIPSGAFKNCIETDMQLDMKLVFEPGGATCGETADGGAGFVPREFPDDAPCGEHGFDTVREITLSRCAGCHTTPSIYEGLAPLVEWQDFRVNTPRSGEKPLYLDMLERIDPANTTATHMPLAPAAPLTSEELAALQTWANEGGHQFTCDSNGNPLPAPDASVPAWRSRPELASCRAAIDEGRTVSDAGCGTVGYPEVAARVLGDSTHAGLCGSCHGATGAPLQDFSTYESAARTTPHPYYPGLSGFEMEYMRMCDHSMPPGIAVDRDGGVMTLMTQWIREGTPREACNGSGSSSSGGPGSATICDVQATVFELGCLGCHGAGGTPPDLTPMGVFSSLVNVDSAYGMPRVTPGNPERSALYLKVAGPSLGDRMPLGGPALGTEDVDLVRRWIEDGASLECDVPDAGVVDAGPPPMGPYFYEDVLPIFQRQCISCHQPGGIGPFRLDDYATAASHAAAVKAYTAARLMPPWNVDNSGACHTYKEAAWLTDAEIAVLGDWADHGAQEGNPANAPGTPDAGPPPPLGSTVAVLDPGVEYTPTDTPNDDYRCFIVDPGVPSGSTQYLVGYDVVPGAPEVVHHVVLFNLESQAAVNAAVALDNADPGPGYTCYGGAGVPSSTYVAWAPGSAATRYPEGTGLAITGGLRMVMQIHYNTDPPKVPAADRTTVRLGIESSVPRPAVLQLVSNNNFTLMPGQPEVVVETTQSLSNLPAATVQVHGVFPHMHERGRSMRIYVTSNAGEACVSDVYRWDFHWQRGYFFETPLTASRNSTLHVDCTYDTTNAPGPITFGEGTADEMCLVFFYVTL